MTGRVVLYVLGALLVLFGLLYAIFSWALPFHKGMPQVGLDQGRVIIGGHALDVEIARTEEQIDWGLMYRTSIAENTGMLFVLDRSKCFWTKDTYVPLSLAFIGRYGRVLMLDNMAPNSRTTYCSLAEAGYALQVPQGWFDARGVAVGDAMSIRP